MLGGGPPDEDPLPDVGVDPHPLPEQMNQPAFDPTGALQQNIPEEEEEDGWGHWAMGVEQGNAQPMQLDPNAGLNNILQAMEVEEIQDNHGDQPIQDEDSALTISLSSSEGTNLVNPANQMVIFGEEVQHPMGQFAEQQALGFQQIAQGLLNLIEAYQDVDEDEVIEADNVNDVEDFMLEGVNLLHPNEAHL
jgi:hypothetical protein